jgi:HEAT repeat protein
MKTPDSITTAIAATAVLTAVNSHADPVEDLVAKIKSPDDKIRGPAWQGAAGAGAAAVKPLAAVMSDSDIEVARAAKRAVWLIVRHAGRPGADGERKAVQAALLGILKDQPATVRKEALWMLSEIGDAEAVAPMAALLADAEVREDARCAMMRLPGPQVTEALNQAFSAAPEEFKFALAESLRQRGQTVNGYPSQKRVPVKQTTLSPTPPATKPGS